MKKTVLLLTAIASAAILNSQEPVKTGRASYAPYPPAYKGKTDQHEGFNASYMLTRKIYADETDRNGNPRPIPTNDWWTDVINNQFSGALWSYPAMLKTSAEGVTMAYPTHWNENGTEVKSDSWLKVQGQKFTASESRAVDWHDWDVEIFLPSTRGDGSGIKATLAHGVPFSWFEFSGVIPEITFSGTPEIVDKEKEGLSLRIGDDLYGLYYSSGTNPTLSDGTLRLEGAGWLSVALLQTEDDFTGFKPYASSVIRSTEVSWSYDESSSLLSTSWQAKAENLRNPGSGAPVMQGFLPHVWKHAVQSTIPYNGISYLTPRGTMKMAAADNGRFEYSYRFAGMLPWYAAPSEGNTAAHPYNPTRMRSLMESYANGGSFGDDTYWGGKGLTQMALNMTFAKETGQTDLYEQSKRKLREALVNWLTYTPGENTKFFSYYPRWGGMLGFDVSYDSDTFNDHHFHYGYFIYSAALLCLEDESFRAGYGDLLKMIAKDYANYDRDDTRFPFLRNLDPWAGHSYAGGLGDHGNDNGNGQESSSEAMQGWGGVYLLGVALDDRQMRDAGIFGWLTESRGTVEYWFDRDHIYPGREHNYDYTLYESPYNTNLTSKGIGWWTWFSGDPLWMHSIQWMPVSPCLNYLSEDLGFVKWDYETMRSSTAYSWFEKSGEGDPLADQSVGNVALCYMERYDPQGAAEIFDQAWDRSMGIARGIDTGHISYFVIHSHLTYGDIDFGVSADCPTANAYRKADGTMTYIVYNPGKTTRKVTFYRDGVAEKTVSAPAGKLTAFSAAPVPTSISVTSEAGFILPPGSTTPLQAILLDQYGAEMEGRDITWQADNGATVTSAGVLTIPSSTAKGTIITLTVRSGNVSRIESVTVNDTPVAVNAEITGVPDFTETGSTLTLSLAVTDQYGNTSAPEAEWNVTDASGSVIDCDNGTVSFATAGRHTITATAGKTTASATVVVLPPLPNVAGRATATSSSEENVGTKTEYAIDGDPTTRWGSQHSDDQWLMLDLGEDFRISSVTINWEAAYAADYDIQVMPDGGDINDENSWMTICEQRGLSSPGIIRHSVAATGRYLRVKCLRRGSAYGYSILEIEVGGISVKAGADTPAGIEISAPAIMLEGEAAKVSARMFNFVGEELPASNLQWNSTPAGTFSGTTFTPATYGVHTLTARSGDMTATENVLVEESTKLTSLSVTPQRLSLLTGDGGEIQVEGRNQFGGAFPISMNNLKVTVSRKDGTQVSAETASFDTATGIFTARQRGDYLIDFDGKATVEATVRDVAEANLAAGKSVRASSSQGDNTPGKVTDLNLETRWESDRADGEWIAIDLERPYMIGRIVLEWEGAYASSYSIETSMDGDRWFKVYETSAGKGGKETITIPEVPASQIRVTCLKRATVWGNSLYEVEVYGKSRFEAVNTGKLPVIGELDYTTGNGTLEGSVSVSHPDGLTVFTTQTLYRPDGSVAATSSATTGKVNFSFSGLKTATYRLVTVAEDPFGNRSEMSKEIPVTYSSEGINLALNKPAEATSSENENAMSGAMAVDGDMATRWGSTFNDDESLTVDLADTYLVNNVRIYWNSPAFATRYSVELSNDGVNFQKVHGRDDWSGGVDDTRFNETPARYVRVTGHSRATQYGTSIDELEVYGKDYLAASITEGITPDETPDGISQDTPADIYSMDGTLLLHATPLSEARQLLPPGIYLATDGRHHMKIIF